MTEEVKTQAQLLTELQTALTAGDFKAVAKVSKEIAGMQATAEKSEREAKQEVLKQTTIDVKDAIDKVVSEFYDAGSLDVAEGVWYSQDFEENIVTCRLMKRASTGGTGGTKAGKGRKFPSTAELLKDHGEEVEEKSGKTWNELYEEAKGDGNKVYQVRQKLAKALGIA